MQELAHQPGLPHPGRAENGHEVTYALRHDLLIGLVKQPAWALATDHRRFEPPGPTRCAGLYLEEPVHLDRFGFAFGLDRLRRLDRRRVAHEPLRFGSDKDLRWLGRLLEASGDVHRIAA